jgi:hypothetical protein
MRNPQGVQLEKDTQNNQHASKHPARLAGKIPCADQNQNYRPKAVEVAQKVDAHVVQQDEQANQGDDSAGEHTPVPRELPRAVFPADANAGMNAGIDIAMDLIAEIVDVFLAIEFFVVAHVVLLRSARCPS